MDIGSLLSTAAAAGPPARRGDSASGHKAVVNGMKAGLAAQYAKSGQMSLQEAKAVTAKAAAASANSGQATCPSQMVEDLKIGLRAHYKKAGTPVEETTMSPNVGTQPDRALGGPTHWGGGMPSKRRDRPMEKSGSSLRGNIQALEKNLEQTLLGLSNKKGFAEDADVKSLLVDALSDYILSGDGSKLRDLKMKATLSEASEFIGDPAPEVDTVLTSSNDVGAMFTERMGSNSAGPIVEMVATQLSSGMPIRNVRSNVAAAMQSTVNSNVRGTLMRVARVLAEL